MGISRRNKSKQINRAAPFLPQRQKARKAFPATCLLGDGGVEPTAVAGRGDGGAAHRLSVLQPGR